MTGMSQLSCTVGVIGVGSMGGAIARGLIESGTLAPERVMVADQDAGKRGAFESLGCRAFPDGAQMLPEGPDVVVLAVKPQVLPGVMASCAASEKTMSVLYGKARSLTSREKKRDRLAVMPGLT